MRFFHKKRETFSGYVKRVQHWHKKFLWLPTKVNKDNTRWLEFVWRRAIKVIGNPYISIETTFEYLPFNKLKPVEDKLLKEKYLYVFFRSFTQHDN